MQWRNGLGPLTRIGKAAALVGLYASLAICGVSAGAHAEGKVYNFVLSNNFLGNDGRVQEEKVADLTAKVAPFAGRVNMKIVNSQNTIQAQVTDLQSIIAGRPDALFIIASSDTALNPTIQTACDAGIKVFMLQTPVNLPCVWNINDPFRQGMVAAGQWMAKVLGGKGNILIDRGIPGISISQDIVDGFMEGLNKYGPDIKVVGKFDGQFAAGPEQAGISSLLVSNPDIQGIMTQGYCTPVFNAMKNAGKESVPATCFAYNGEMLACAADGNKCAILSAGTGVVQQAMLIALDALDGKQVPPAGSSIFQDMKIYMTPNATVPLEGIEVSAETLAEGVNMFSELPAGTVLPATLPQFNDLIKDLVAK